MTSNCPDCATPGYCPGRPGVLYAVRDRWSEILKIGISGAHALDRRLAAHRGQGLDRVVFTLEFEDGRVAQELERRWLQLRREIVVARPGLTVTKEELADGHSEAVIVEDLDALLGLVRERVLGEYALLLDELSSAA